MHSNEIIPEDYGRGPLSRSQIHARHTGTKEVVTYPLGGGGGFTLRYATLSQRGYYPEDLYKANQDAHVVHLDFDGVSGDALFGVFDGHGRDGDLCSRFVRDNLNETLTAALKTSKSVGAALTSSFVQLNRQLNAITKFDTYFSGTTAVTALIQTGANGQPLLHIANVGDSRAILGERRGQRIVPFPLSVDQTPHRKDERARCKKAGSVIRTSEMIDGLRRYSLAWEDALGTAGEEENSGDPPRLFAKGQVLACLLAA